MSIYSVNSAADLLKYNTYPGRGIITGITPDGKRSVCAYFIMGRSTNSRNRVFVIDNGEVFTKAFDESKVVDPSLIIYAAVRQYKDRLIVTNGNQTDTVYDGFGSGMSFSEALAQREFEPDKPNYTPRISAVINHGDKCSYSMNILKSIDADGSACARYTFDYPCVPGLGHFIHTYVCDGSPIPTFQGEPERIATCDDIDAFTNEIWDNLNCDNKISLYVRFTDISTGKYEDRLVNKNK